MLNITILAVGKIKEKFWREAGDEYIKRLRPYAKLEIKELKPEPFSSSTKEKSKEKEGERILEFLDKQKEAMIFLLDETGEENDSFSFARKLDQQQGKIIFVIGGALGLTSEIKKRYKKISLSQMTFPHEMARVILLEQLYRASTILNNKDYHY